MAKSIIKNIRKIEGTNKIAMDIFTGVDTDVTILLTEKFVTNKFVLYLRSTINSITHYVGESNKIETTYMAPRVLSMYKVCLSCKTEISIIGYKDEDYLLIKFDLRTIAPKPVYISKEIYLSTKEAWDLINNQIYPIL